jgi:hypothetical protein
MLPAALLVVLAVGGAWGVQEAAPPAQEEQKAKEEALLQKLANPLAALASFAIIGDFDYHVGPLEEGHRSTWNLKPTIPLHLGDEWNVISRTNLPVIYQEDIAPGSGAQAGVGDLVEALYLAAVQPGRRGWIWGAGPLIRMPTGSDPLLTAGKWAVGPSVAAVKQQDDFTFGLIAGQLWSVAGSDQRSDISVCTLEPFVTYRAEGLWNLSLHMPCSYDFHARQWTIPATLTVEKLVSYQRYPVTISFGLRYWADAPDNAPHDLAFQFGLTVVFPN